MAELCPGAEKTKKYEGQSHDKNIRNGEGGNRDSREVCCYPNHLGKWR